MKKTALLALSLLSLTAGVAFAEGEGNGPLANPNSLPPGFLDGTPQYMAEQSAYDYFVAQANRDVAVASSDRLGGLRQEVSR